jgi:hypothetical protein
MDADDEAHDAMAAALDARASGGWNVRSCLGRDRRSEPDPGIPVGTRGTCQNV